MDSELSDANWEAKTDHDMEGTLLHLRIPPLTLTRASCDSQTRLAVSRNANDESEVDDVLLNAGLFTYPILQAADILAYRQVKNYSQEAITINRPMAGPHMYLSERTSNNISS
jgi:tryptophanyl-tRNA synthetase